MDHPDPAWKLAENHIAEKIVEILKFDNKESLDYVSIEDCESMDLLPMWVSVRYRPYLLDYYKLFSYAGGIATYKFGMSTYKRL